jgi:hypothetical protein
MSAYYMTDTSDPDAPVLLEEYRGYRPGDRVVDESPHRPLPGPLTVDEIYCFRDCGTFGDVVTVILNGGQWEVSGDSLRPAG